ncbi:hypothetical protein EII17_14585 [Clostridiales bacterium COT073_COT-073]|nr:hypothetical protein EII17_14585 [Clostridiales bacterium COT073_COT-073]
MNNKDNQNMITTKIEGTDFTYDKDTHYERDGHIYCKTCNERIDGKAIPMLNKSMIIRTACKCVRDRQEQEKQREKLLKQDRLRQNCFISKNQIAYTFENADENTDKDIIKKARNYVKHFDEMRKDNVGIDERIDLEKIVEVKMQIEELYKALATLTKEERELIEAIFYKEKSLRSIGRKEKVSHQVIIKRRDRILEKLRRCCCKTIKKSF